jgi:5-(aminomethyl)-3-furanmethanol phosphate kinase
MWVVKLGGSLNGDPCLPQWLDLLDRFGGGRVALVCGGGGFADEARRLHGLWQLDELPAHNMAVLAMVQTAYLAQGLHPRLKLACNMEELHAALRAGRAALWLPFDCLRTRPDADANWGVTSDSIALDLARRLNAERLVVVKSCSVQADMSLTELSKRGVLDERFAQKASGVSFPIDVVQRDQFERVRGMLQS